MRVRICSFVDTVSEVSDGRRKYRFEFSEMFGPTLIDARGNVLKNQPVSETHPFWRPFNQWHQDYRSKQAVKP